MIKTGMAILVAALVLGGPAHEEIRTLATGMVRVALPGTGKRSLQVSRFEVTVAEWRVCFEDGGCSHMPAAPNADESVPVTSVNWFDVTEYLSWINARGDLKLRLPTLPEWREISRALPHRNSKRLFSDPRLAWAADYGGKTTASGPPRRSGSFSSTPEGVFDLDGNVWEWTATCVSAAFETQGENLCPAYIAAGEHEAPVSVFIRDPASGGCALGTPPAYLGLRLVSGN